MIKKISQHLAQINSSWLDMDRLKVVAISSITVTGALLGLRAMGTFQQLELLSFDQMIRWRPQQPIDPRLVIISISETDLRIQNRWPLPDQTIATLLEKLQTQQPRVIGLDIYRNLPVEPKENNGAERLAIQLQKPNLIAIQSIDAEKGTPPPPNLDPSKVGFNDIILDSPDNVVRRNIFLANPPNSDQKLASFSLQLAVNYLQKDNIYPQSSQINRDYLQLGQAVFVPLQKNSGGYANLESGIMQIMLNYRNSGNPATEVSLSDYLDGRVDPQLVTDKIVLIGSTASSLRDNFFTPYSSTLQENFTIPGVYVHAQMVSQFLDAATGKRPIITFWSESQEHVWIFLWVLLGAALPVFVRHPFKLLVGVVALGAVVVGFGFLLFLNYVWIPVAAPVIGFAVTAAAVVSHRAYEVQQQNAIVMKLLGQSTSPNIAKTLWRERDNLLKSGKLPGIQLTATTLFLDIKGFSTISEQMSPENLLEWLNEILAEITREVMYREGIINKFTGDGVMAVFGVPLSRRKPAEIVADTQRSVYAALAIADRLEVMNKKFRQQGRPEIQMRIGIYTGTVVVGSLGSKERIEYGVIGDSVNIASRLESCEKERQPSNCRILIGYETLVHLEDRFIVESWGEKDLKGKNQKVKVYLVKGAKVPESVALGSM
jgi:CHASE2 domain-containing sensor protein